MLRLNASWSGTGRQFLLNFDTAPVLRTRQLKRPRGSERKPTDSALAWFGRAMRLQDESVGEARRTYHEAIRLRPSSSRRMSIWDF